MSAKKKRTFLESLDRSWRLFVIFMAKDMTLRNAWALFLGPTAAGILTWTLIPKAFYYAFFKMPVFSTALQRTFAPAEIVCPTVAYTICAYLTYVLLKPFCRGLVVCHPNYFNEGSIR